LSNPRRATNHSTALPPLQSCDGHATAHFARCQHWFQPDFVEISNCDEIGGCG